MRYAIKARLAEQRRTSREMIAELRKRGFRVDPGDFSRYISGKSQGATADRVTAEADRILTEWEGKTQ
jgi:hypothetical protein